MKYIYPKLSRFDFYFIRAGGHGLGNLLFPIARAFLAARSMSCVIIEPTHLQIKIGDLLNLDRKARFYARDFKRIPGSLRGLNRIYRLICMRAFAENEQALFHRANSGIMVVSGLGRYFGDVEGHQGYLLQKFKGLAPSEDEKEIEPFIAVHIRRGDFKVGRSLTPIEWFKGFICKGRMAFPQSQIRIFSDGTDAEIAGLLRAAPNVVWSRKRPLDEIIDLSKAQLLIGSANSTFSYWGAFLGNVPSVFYSGIELSGALLGHNPKCLYLSSADKCSLESLRNLASEKYAG